MRPEEIGRSYDAITDRWHSPERPLPGVSQLERAMTFLTTQGRHALDAGCGCGGRIVDALEAGGMAVTGVDVSERMIALARQRHPNTTFHHADLVTWPLPRRYDLIIGWDSLWHLPLADQPAVLRKLCDGLNPGGVILFTFGGLPEPGETRDAHMGVPMYHATPGVPQTLALLAEGGCVVRHLEYDQWPQLHAVVIAQKA